MIPIATGMVQRKRGGGCLEDNSLCMDRLCMELVKMADTRGVLTLLYFFVR